MRVHGRITNPNGSKQWVTVSTDPTTGSNSWVFLTSLCQALLLNLGEAPFDAGSGLPAHEINPLIVGLELRGIIEEREGKLRVAK